MTIETGVLERYSEGAESRQADLCCPVDYDRELLAILPREIIEKDYGCGDPSRYVKKVTWCWIWAPVPARSVTWLRNWWASQARSSASI